MTVNSLSGEIPKSDDHDAVRTYFPSESGIGYNNGIQQPPAPNGWPQTPSMPTSGFGMTQPTSSMQPSPANNYQSCLAPEPNSSAWLISAFQKHMQQQQQQIMAMMNAQQQFMVQMMDTMVNSPSRKSDGSSSTELRGSSVAIVTQNNLQRIPDTVTSVSLNASNAELDGPTGQNNAEPIKPMTAPPSPTVGRVPSDQFSAEEPNVTGDVDLTFADEVIRNCLDDISQHDSVDAFNSIDASASVDSQVCVAETSLDGKSSFESQSQNIDSVDVIVADEQTQNTHEVSPRSPDILNDEYDQHEYPAVGFEIDTAPNSALVSATENMSHESYNDHGPSREMMECVEITEQDVDRRNNRSASPSTFGQYESAGIKNSITEDRNDGYLTPLDASEAFSAHYDRKRSRSDLGLTLLDSEYPERDYKAAKNQRMLDDSPAPATAVKPIKSLKSAWPPSSGDNQMRHLIVESRGAGMFKIDLENTLSGFGELDNSYFLDTNNTPPKVAAVAFRSFDGAKACFESPGIFLAGEELFCRPDFEWANRNTSKKASHKDKKGQAQLKSIPTAALPLANHKRQKPPVVKARLTGLEQGVAREYVYDLFNDSCCVLDVSEMDENGSMIIQFSSKTEYNLALTFVTLDYICTPGGRLEIIEDDSAKISTGQNVPHCDTTGLNPYSKEAELSFSEPAHCAGETQFPVAENTVPAVIESDIPPACPPEAHVFTTVLLVRGVKRIVTKATVKSLFLDFGQIKNVLFTGPFSNLNIVIEFDESDSCEKALAAFTGKEVFGCTELVVSKVFQPTNPGINESDSSVALNDSSAAGEYAVCITGFKNTWSFKDMKSLISPIVVDCGIDNDEIRFFTNDKQTYAVVIGLQIEQATVIYRSVMALDATLQANSVIQESMFENIVEWMRTSPFILSKVLTTDELATLPCKFNWTPTFKNDFSPPCFIEIGGFPYMVNGESMRSNLSKIQGLSVRQLAKSSNRSSVIIMCTNEENAKLLFDHVKNNVKDIFDWVDPQCAVRLVIHRSQMLKVKCSEYFDDDEIQRLVLSRGQKITNLYRVDGMKNTIILEFNEINESSIILRELAGNRIGGFNDCLSVTSFVPQFSTDSLKTSGRARTSLSGHSSTPEKDEKLKNRYSNGARSENAPIGNSSCF